MGTYKHFFMHKFPQFMILQIDEGLHTNVKNQSVQLIFEETLVPITM